MDSSVDVSEIGRFDFMGKDLSGNYVFRLCPYGYRREDFYQEFIVDGERYCPREANELAKQSAKDWWNKIKLPAAPAAEEGD